MPGSPWRGEVRECSGGACPPQPQGGRSLCGGMRAASALGRRARLGSISKGPFCTRPAAPVGGSLRRLGFPAREGLQLAVWEGGALEGCCFRYLVIVTSPHVTLRKLRLSYSEEKRQLHLPGRLGLQSLEPWRLGLGSPEEPWPFPLLTPFPPEAASAIFVPAAHCRDPRSLRESPRGRRQARKEVGCGHSLPPGRLDTAPVTVSLQPLPLSNEGGSTQRSQPLLGNQRGGHAGYDVIAEARPCC